MHRRRRRPFGLRHRWIRAFPPGRAPRPPQASPSRCARGSSSRAHRARHRIRRPLQVAVLEHAVDEARREAVAAADTGPRISRPGRGVASTNPAVSRPRDRRPVVDGSARTARRVVATTAKFGNSAATCSIFAGMIPCRGRPGCSSMPATSRPRQAVKSSSFPIITSMCSRDRGSPLAPAPPRRCRCHRLGRSLWSYETTVPWRWPRRLPR